MFFCFFLWVESGTISFKSHYLTRYHQIVSQSSYVFKCIRVIPYSIRVLMLRHRYKKKTLLTARSLVSTHLKVSTCHEFHRNIYNLKIMSYELLLNAYREIFKTYVHLSFRGAFAICLRFINNVVRTVAKCIPGNI